MVEMLQGLKDKISASDAQELVRENAALRNQIDLMNQELMQKSERIQQLETQVDSQNKHIEDLELNQEDVIEELEDAHRQELEEVKRFGDEQANALAHMVPAVAATWCLSEDASLNFVEKVIRTTQNTDKAAAFGTAGARVLRRLIAGEDLAQAINSTVRALKTEKERLACCDGEMADRLEQAFRVRTEVSHFVAVNLVGSSCLYPQNLISGAHLLASMGRPDFAAGIRSTILASGDQASRGMFLGAALGAAVGSPEMIPWKSQTRSADEVSRLSKDVVARCRQERFAAEDSAGIGSLHI